MVLDDIKRVAEMIGFQQAPPPPFEQVLARHQQLIKGSIPTKDGPPTETQEAGEATKSLSTPATETKGVDPFRTTENALGAHSANAWTAFKAKMAQTWRPAANYPPRGSIIISGFVELESPKAWIVFDVRAAWDPKTKEFDPRSLYLRTRRLQMRKQAPTGGS